MKRFEYDYIRSCYKNRMISCHQYDHRRSCTILLRLFNLGRYNRRFSDNHNESSKGCRYFEGMGTSSGSLPVSTRVNHVSLVMNHQVCTRLGISLSGYFSLILSLSISPMRELTDSTESKCNFVLHIRLIIVATN